MKKAILEHPLYFLFSSSDTRKTFKEGKNSRLKYGAMAAPFIILLLMGYTAICSCTLFSLACFLQLLMVVLLAGRRAVTSISSEKENKTLDLLRLTSLGSTGIIWGKLIPEAIDLGRILIVTSPFLLLMALLFPGISIWGAMAAVLINTAAGITLLSGLICLSACSSTASSAIVFSWILRGVWIFITPMIDGLIATVFLSSYTTPIFSSLNPALALMALLMPGSLDGTRWIWGAFLFLPVVALFIFASIKLAAGFIERGDKNSSNTRASFLGLFPGGTTGEKISDRFKIFSNPIFLKEMVSFRRDFPGLIPGILVFAILFLAPCFYCMDSSVKMWYGSSLLSKHRNVYIETELNDTYNSEINPGIINPENNTVTVRTETGEVFSLKGHKPDGCLRVGLYEYFALPLPEEASVVAPVYSNNNYGNQTYNYNSSPATGPAPDTGNSPEGPNTTAFTTSAKEMIGTQDKGILFVGFYMGVFLLLIYLVIRCSGFLCSTYNTEKNKLTWDVLTMTQLSPEDIVGGKLLGVLFVPLAQLTLGFMAVLFWIHKDILTLWGGITLYLFCVGIALVSGLLGQYNSINSPSAHSSQGSTLIKILIFGLALPLFKISSFVAGSILMVSGSAFGVLIIIPAVICLILYFFSLRPFAILFFLINLIYIRFIPGSFLYVPFLTSDSFSKPLTVDPITFIFAMAFIVYLGYFLWRSTVVKIREAYYS